MDNDDEDDFDLVDVISHILSPQLISFLEGKCECSLLP